MSKGEVLLALVAWKECVGAVTPPGEAPRHRFPSHAVTTCLESIYAFFDEMRAQIADHALIGAAIAIEGRISGGTAVCEGSGLTLDLDRIRRILEAPRVQFMTAKGACALGAPLLSPAERMTICEGVAPLDRPLAVVGSGAALAMSYAVPTPSGGWTPLDSEGVRISVQARGSRESAAAEILWRTGRRSAETILCAPGLSALCSALESMDGHAPGPNGTEEMVARALAGDPIAIEAMRIFCCWLGAFCRQSAMMGASEGGVYLVSAFFRQIQETFDGAAFAGRFRRTGAGDSYLEGVPVWMATASAGLIGLSSVFSSSDARMDAARVMVLDC